jgi:AcrR family transcriptional regulator
LGRTGEARRHAPAAQRRAKILEAAIRCFGEKGYHEATMDDLAAAAGLSKGSLYWHFRSKQDVFLALFDAYAEEVLAGLAGLERAGGPILEGLRRQGEAALERLGTTLSATRAWLEFLSHPEARRRLASVYARTRATTAGLLQQGIARQEIRALPVEAVAGGFVALIEGLLMQAFADPGFDARSHWDASFDVLIRGLAANAREGTA